MIGLLPSIPTEAYNALSSSRDLKVPSGLIVWLQGTLTAPEDVTGLNRQVPGTPSGANMRPSYSARLRMSKIDYIGVRRRPFSTRLQDAPGNGVRLIIVTLKFPGGRRCAAESKAHALRLPTLPYRRRGFGRP